MAGRVQLHGEGLEPQQEEQLMEEDTTTVTVRSNEESGTCARCHLLKVSKCKGGGRAKTRGREGGRAKDGGTGVAKECRK